MGAKHTLCNLSTSLNSGQQAGDKNPSVINNLIINYRMHILKEMQCDCWKLKCSVWKALSEAAAKTV